MNYKKTVIDVCIREDAHAPVFENLPAFDLIRASHQIEGVHLYVKWPSDDGVRIQARNSALFYGASALFKPAGPALLAREMFARRARRIVLRVGHLRRIPADADGEAVLKAIGTGWVNGIAWTDVEVVLLPTAQPTVALHARAAEIAAALGIPEGTVKSRLSHARAQLAACVSAVLQRATTP